MVGKGKRVVNTEVGTEKYRTRRTWFRGQERVLVIGKGKGGVNTEVGTEKSGHGGLGLGDGAGHWSYFGSVRV